MKSIILVISLVVATFAAQSLSVISWGGVYSKAQKKYMVDPFEAKTGVKVYFDDYSGGLAEIKAQVESHNIKWDVVDLEYIDVDKACSENLLVRIGTSFLPKGANGVSAKKDFYPAALSSPCAVGNIYWAIVYAYNPKVYTIKKPTTIADFFNLKKFPGKRAMRKRAQVNLEWALIADGVPKNKVYQVLATEKGQARAFKKLDTIKNSIIWFSSWSQAPQLLADGSAVMVQAANGRVTHFGVVWDANAFDLDGWGILRGTKKLKLAKEFIAFTTSTKPLVGMASINYGPTRVSSTALIPKKIQANLPSSHLKEGFKVNGEFWSDYGTDLNAKFNAWLLK